MNLHQPADPTQATPVSHPSPSTASTTTLLCAIFFLTGASALIFEIAWFHLCGLAFGNSIWATSIVLSSFMGGLALGNALSVRFASRIHRAMLAYAVAEIFVGVAGFALTIILAILPHLTGPWFATVTDSPALVQIMRLGGAFLLLLIPTTAMGATLPFLVTALSSGRFGYGTALGQLYGANTLGAVAGVLLYEICLARWFGVRGAATCAALANLVAAGVAIAILRSARTVTPEAPAIRSRTSREGSPRVAVLATLLASAFLSGATLLALEVSWFRFLLMFVSNTSLAQAAMLATVLLGIGAGAWLAGLWLRKRTASHFDIGMVGIAAALLVFGTYIAFQIGSGESPPFDWRPIIGFSLRLMFPVALASGALFVLQGAVLDRILGNSTRSTGALALSNTIGAMCGAMLAGFVCLPHLGMEKTFFLAAIIYLCIAILASWPHRGWTRMQRGSAAVGCLVFVLLAALFPHGLMDREYFTRVANRFTNDGSKPLAARETPTETILYLRQDWLDQPVYYRLVTNGFSMSGTGVTAQRYMRMFAYLPAALRAEPLRKALLISYGVGVTASALRDLRSLETIDVVDISRDIVEMSDLVYPETEHPLRDPRFRLHIEDGRFFLLTTPERFDLITGEPPPPRVPGTVNLYTREHFQLIHDRLNPGGFATYWLPINDLLESDTKAIIGAFAAAFPDFALWMGTPFDWILVGRREGGQPATMTSVLDLWADPIVGKHLRDTGFETPALMAAAFLGDGSDWREIVRQTGPLTDDRPKRLTTLFGPPSEERFSWFSLMTNSNRCRNQFGESRFVSRTWPQDLKQESLAAFDLQPVFNNVLRAAPSPLGEIAALDHVLSNTQLKTLPLWMMGSDAVHDRIAREAQNNGDGAVEYARGVGFLADRDYASAANAFARAQTSGWNTPTCRGLEVYALCKAGSIDAARILATAARPANSARPGGGADQSTFWIWMSRTFGI